MIMAVVVMAVVVITSVVMMVVVLYCFFFLDTGSYIGQSVVMCKLMPVPLHYRFLII